MNLATNKTLKIEICVEGIDGFLAAQSAGADRVELCASLVEGGLTPSLGVIKETLARAKIPFHVIVRPRGGDFLYSETEFETMLEDVRVCRELGVAGVVIGCLTAEGRIDETRTSALVAAAGPLAVTCHRAFDMVADFEQAIEALVRSGVSRVLTSGLCDTALNGKDNLKAIVTAAAGRIVVMGCGELDEHNIGEVLVDTGVDELHFAALKVMKSGMKFHNSQVGMGGTNLEREFEITLTDEAAVRRTIGAARAVAQQPAS